MSTIAKKGKLKKREINKTLWLRSKLWLILNIVFSIIYLIWRALYTIPFEYGVVSVIAGVTLFIVEFLGMFEALIHYFNMTGAELNPVPVIPQTAFPDVDVFIATYNEPEDVLFKTINGCLHMEYPDKNKIHIYLCDDGRRKEMRALAERMGVHYLDREDNKHAKAGNLNNALSKTNSPYVVTMDADMIPRREFLLHTIPYFIAQEIENEGKEEKDQRHIGFVQTPQAFYNPDLFQFNLYSENRIPNEQDYFYRDIQVSRNKSNSVIYGGSNTVIARRALNDIEGFYTGSITEDYATGILIQKQGYICMAVDEVLASGLSPTDLKSLIAQRIRWARGVISSNRKMHILLTRKLTFSQKLNYWASKWYWYAPIKRLVYFISPIMYATFGYMVIKCTLGQILLFWLPMYITSNISLKMLSGNMRTTKWTGVYETVLFPYLLIPVILETFGITMKKFKVTKKGNVENEKGTNILYMLPFVLLVVLSVIGTVNCVRMIFSSNDLGPIVVLFWLIVNLFTLVMAMFFVMGRNFLRKSDRAMVQVDCEIKTNTSYHCYTKDISETGLAVLLDYPADIDDKKDVIMHLTDHPYKAELKAALVHVNSVDDKWRYAFKITDYCGTYEEYLQIIFDRVPTLPQNLKQSSGSFDDLKINVSRRASSPFYENRCLPRIVMKTTLPAKDGSPVRLLDFNYKYCSLPKMDSVRENLTLIVDEASDTCLECRRVQELSSGKVLYEVVNYPMLYEELTKKSILEKWTYNEWKNAKKEEQPEEQKSVDFENNEKRFDEMNYI